MNTSTDHNAVQWLFLDLNAFFASCEQQKNPALRGKPVIVVQTPTDSACAIAASYAAKSFGIKTGTLVRDAQRLCPGVIRMTLADLTVDIVAIVRPIAGKRRNRARNLLQQGTDLRAVIDILAGQLGGDDLSSVGVHPDMELSPGPTRSCGVLLNQPLTGTAYVDGPRLARVVQLRRSGRLRSYVRPLLCGRFDRWPRRVTRIG